MFSLKISTSYCILCCICLSACGNLAGSEQTQPDHTEIEVPMPSERQAKNTSAKTEASAEQTAVPSETVASGDKLALIIAISQYQEGTGWNDISAYNDVPLITAALVSQGFDTLRHVAVIQDAKATKDGIIEAFNTQLIHKAQVGSKVLIHYSGHGQQVEDLNGDELDRYDEALVAYDAPKRAQGKYEGYQGERHLLDDELEVLLKALREKVGPTGQVVVVLDACHSGTATRGVGKARGTHYKIESGKPTSAQSEHAKSDDPWLQQEKQPALAPLIVLSGASAGELNYETKDEQGRNVGSLSYAFSRAFAQADDRYTFQGLFDHIKVDMGAFAPLQSPQLEGDVHLKVLGGELSKGYTFFTPKEMYDARHLSIHGGELLGVHQEAEVEFYPIDVQDTALVEPKATGTVIQAHLSESDVLLDQPMAKEVIQDSWAFVTTKSFGSTKVYIQMNTSSSSAFAQRLKEVLQDSPQIQWVTDNPDLLIEITSTEHHGVSLLSADGLVIYKNVVDEQNQRMVSHQLQQHISDFAQARYLRKLRSTVPELALEFEIIPIRVEQQGSRLIETERIPLAHKIASDHTLELKKGDYIKLKVTNRGQKKAFFSLLDIQPDHQINVLFPTRYRTQEEFFVEAGQSLEPEDIFQIGEPYGLEYFKLIATSKPINIQPLLQKQRGGELVSSPPPSAHVETLLFRIVE